MTSHRLAVAAGVVALSVLATACSSSATSGTPAQPPANHSTPPAGAASSASHAAAPDPTTSAASTASQDVNVCALLPAATVAQLTGVHVKTAKPGAPVPSGVPMTLSSCDYEGGLTQLDITYTKSQFSESQFDQDYQTNKQVISKTAMVSGIGDKAFTDDFPSEWLEVYWDGAVYEISGASTVSVEAAKNVVTTLHDKL